MSSMKRVRLAVLTLVATAIFSSAPALAGGVIKLLPTDVEPSASGTVRWGKGHAISSSQGAVLYRNNVRVTCKGLTPGDTYRVCGSLFIADEVGAGEWADTMWYWDVRPSIDVRNEANEVVLTQ